MASPSSESAPTTNSHPEPASSDTRDEAIARTLLAELAEDSSDLRRAFRRHPRTNGRLFRKTDLIAIYRDLVEQGSIAPDPQLFRALRVKPRRTQSGVATVTVLTKPFPCPGKCTFCPTDARMPKSYLPDEPGCMRAERHQFDPFEQVAARIRTLYENGHPVDKIELLILGGTWSAYANDYQDWFILRCLDAMNGQDSESLGEAQARNETATHRNVGMVIETRPDHIRPGEIRRLRQLGVTKIQMGAQSLSDEVLRLNQRGHDVAATRRAMDLLRRAGLKLVLHWMPNLLGSSAEKDLVDFARLWNDLSLQPDEIKIYPCSLLEKAELFDYWKRGEYEPYDDPTLIELVAGCKTMVPRYCRINRVYRDIPADNIVAGTTLNNLRQCVQEKLAATNRHCSCIRCREVVRDEVSVDDVEFRSLEYATTHGREHFLSANTGSDRLAGYLRLSLPHSTAPDLDIPEIAGASLVREVHVFGQAQHFGSVDRGVAQHVGLGRRLLQRAEEIAFEGGYRRMAIIASVGTRGYYAARGYALVGTYMVKELEAGI